MIYTLTEIKEKIIPIAQKHGVNSFSLFGSYAKNKTTEDSDLDLIMDDGEVDTLVKYISLVNDLEREFECHVDLVSSHTNNTQFLKKISKEILLLYEK